MSILITGGAGYIGSHCNKAFRENGYDTIVLDDLSNGHREAVGETELIVGDIGDKKLLGNIFTQNKIDGVIHLAAKKSVEESVINPSLYYEENVVKTKTLIDVMLENKINIFVFSSTASVYGDVGQTIIGQSDIGQSDDDSMDQASIDENFPTDPINPYGQSKLMVEHILEDYDAAYGLNFCSLRYFNVAGADPAGEIGSSGKEEKNIMPILMKAVSEGQKIKVNGDDYNTRDGSCIRDYIHVMDLAEAHLLAYEYLKKGDGSCSGGDCSRGDGSCIVNLGSRNGYSVLELIRETETVTGKKINYEIGPRRAGDPEIIVASNKKAEELLGWVPKRSNIQDIIRDSYNWELSKKY